MVLVELRTADEVRANALRVGRKRKSVESYRRLLRAKPEPVPGPLKELHEILAAAPRPLCGPLALLPLGIRAIQIAVAKYTGVSVNDILSQRRTANIVMPRQIAMYLCKEITKRSLPEIGRRFGNRDHTTVLHAVRKIERMIADDPDFAAQVEEIKRIIGA